MPNKQDVKEQAVKEQDEKRQDVYVDNVSSQ